MESFIAGILISTILVYYWQEAEKLRDKYSTHLLSAFQISSELVLRMASNLVSAFLVSFGDILLLSISCTTIDCYFSSSVVGFVLLTVWYIFHVRFVMCLHSNNGSDILQFYLSWFLKFEGFSDQFLHLFKFLLLP